MIKILRHEERYMYYFRKAQTSKLKKLFIVLQLICGRRYGIEIGIDAKIGTGFHMVHPCNITVSGLAVVGDNCIMLKGSTIGVVNGDWEHWGAPIIGNCVYIGLNSTVIGKIRIGDDVLIAPNTLVNQDVPSHSVVIGNPMQVHHKEQATRYYINDK